MVKVAICSSCRLFPTQSGDVLYRLRFWRDPNLHCIANKQLQKHLARSDSWQDQARGAIGPAPEHRAIALNAVEAIRRAAGYRAARAPRPRIWCQCKRQAPGSPPIRDPSPSPPHPIRRAPSQPGALRPITFSSTTRANPETSLEYGGKEKENHGFGVPDTSGCPIREFQSEPNVTNRRMTHIVGHDRSQTPAPAGIAESLDDYVGSENPVRFIDAFVDGF